MEKYIGKSVYKGTAIGPINVLKKSDGIVKRQQRQSSSVSRMRRNRRRPSSARFMRRRFRRLAR